MIAVLGGLGAACAWAISTLCSSRSSRRIDPPSVVAWMMVVGLVITAPIAAIEGVPKALHGSAAIWLAVSGVGNVVGLMITYAALSIGQVGLVAPLVSTEGAIAATIAVLAGETLAPGVGATLAMIAVGICLAAVPPDGMSEEHRANHPQAVALAVLAAVTFGASLYATARAGSSLPVAWVVLSARLIGTVALALPLALGRRLHMTRRCRSARRHLGGVRGARVLLVHGRRSPRDRGRGSAVFAVRRDRGCCGVLPVRRAAGPDSAGGSLHGDRRRRFDQRAARVNS